MTSNPIIRKLLDTLSFANDHFFAFIDLRIVALGQAQLEIDKLSPEEKDLCYNEFKSTLSQLKHFGLIYKYEIIEDGFKIFPEDKNYIDENHLKLLFTKEPDYDIA